MTDMTTASGTFEVKFAGEAPYDAGEAITLSHDTATKEFAGDLAGASTLHMLSAVSGTPGSAGYVVIEKFDGQLHGRSGSFVLQHFGLMDRGEPELRIQIVPDTGTRELAGIEGTMTIDVVDGVHEYVLSYSLPEADDQG